VGHPAVTRSLRAAPQAGDAPPRHAIVSSFHVVFLAACLAYALFSRAELQTFSAHTGIPANIWDQVLGTVHDPYLIAYFILPIWLVRSASRTRAAAEPQVLIRSRSRVRWLWRTYRDGLADAFAAVLLLVLAACVSLAGLPLDWGWSPLAAEPELASFTVHELVLTGLPPIVVVLGQALHLAIGLAGAGALLSFLHLRSQRALAQYATMVTLWVLTLLSLRRPLEAFDLGDSFVLLHAWTSLGKAAPVAVLWLPVLLLLAQGLLSRSDIRDVGVTEVVCAVAVALVILAAMTSEADDLAGAVVEGFYGGHQIVQYSFVALLALAPVWLFAARLNDVLAGSWVHAELVRSRSLLAWAVRLVLPWIWVSAVMLAGAIALLMGGHLLGLGSRTEVIETGGEFLLAYHLGINGVLQAALLLIWVFLARWLSGQEVASVIAVGVATAFGFPALNQSGWIPLMLHQLYWAPDWSQAYAITTRLTVALTLTILVAGGLSSRPGLRCHERNL
jgi:hypothetical protein